MLEFALTRPVTEDFRKDHRKRLRDRFMQGGADAVPDYELLELVLFRAIPRQDVKPIAKRLIATFGNFNGAISAAPQRLNEVKGVGQAVVQELKIIEAAAHRLARSRVIGKEVLSTWDTLIDYCTTAMAYRETEQFSYIISRQKEHSDR